MIRRGSVIWQLGMIALFLSVFFKTAWAESDLQPQEVPAGYGAIQDFLPCEYPEGSGRWVVLSESDMPWRISVGPSNRPPKGGTREEARKVVIEAMQEWADAIRTQLPWFRLEYQKDDVGADVAVVWKRGSSVRSPGQAEPRCGKTRGQLFTGGSLEIVLQACPTCRVMTKNELHDFVLHHFGHLLGLDNCARCGAAMSEQWDQAMGLQVTRVDVEAAIDWWMRERETPRYEWGDPEPSPAADRLPASKPAVPDATLTWEQKKTIRLYAETAGGGFELVEGWRLRMGPREGERWYTFDEMQAIKDERTAVKKSQ